MRDVKKLPENSSAADASNDLHLYLEVITDEVPKALSQAENPGFTEFGITL